MSGRHPVLGLARARAAWFRDVSRWSSSAALPAEFVKCVSVAELRARLGSGRAWSALLVDAGVAALDRDLVDEARALGCAVLVVDDGRRPRRWVDLGVSAVLSEPVRLAELRAALDAHGRRLDPSEPGAGTESWSPTGTGGSSGVGAGHLVAVTGASGSGTSTVAAALAQGLAARPDHGPVVLADLALHADQAMRHDLGDVVPGLQELVEAHRSGRLAPPELRALLFDLPEHGYHLLAGLRRHRDWAVLRPRATAVALEVLVGAYGTTVADVDPDVEGEDDCGSVDVEERNQLSRWALAHADVVVVTGLPTTVGTHRLVRVLDGLVRFGVAPERLLTTVLQAPRGWPARAAVADAVAALAGAALPPGTGLATPVFVGEQRRLELAVREGRPVPRAMAELVTRPVTALLGRAAPAKRPGPAPVRPGSLGVAERWGATER